MMKRCFPVLIALLGLLAAPAFAQSSLLDYGPAEVSGTSTHVPSLAPVEFLDQAPNQVNGLFADSNCGGCGTGQQSIADNFVAVASGPTVGITEIIFWGGYFPENIPNPTDDFTIIISTDAGGSPGAVVDSRSGLEADSRVATGVVLFGVDEYVFTFDYIASPVILASPGTYWIEIFNNSTSSTNFFWETGDLDGANGVAGSAFAFETPGVVWNLDGATNLAVLINGDDDIPVELVSFTATTSGTNVSLNWATASETNNAGFEVQALTGESWNALGWVEGHGTTTEAQNYVFSAEGMDVGTHTFRLKQIDFDGAFEYSDELEVAIETPGSHVLSAAYPNPFNPQSQFTLAVAQDQQVTAELFNTLGQRVAVLFNGTVEANQTQTVTIDGAGLASGMYVVRVNGELFSDALRVTLLK